MKMNNLCTSSTFMKVIYILRYDSHFMFFLQFCNKSMCHIRFYLREFLPSHIIEVQTLLWFIIKTICACKVLELFLCPQSIFTTERT